MDALANVDEGMSEYRTETSMKALYEEMSKMHGTRQETLARRNSVHPVKVKIHNIYIFFFSNVHNCLE